MSTAPRSARPRGWLWWLLVTVVATQTTLNLCRPLISYRSVALGADALHVGLITAAFALLPLFVAVPLGRLSDRLRRTAWIVAAGIVLMALAPLLLALSQRLTTVAAGSAVLGLGHLTFMVAAQRMIAQRSGEDALDRNFGLLTASAALGQLVGPLLSSLLLADASSGQGLGPQTQQALLVAALTAALGLPAVLGVWSATQPRAERGAAALPLPDLLRRPGVPAGLFTSLALLSAVDLLIAYLPLVADQRGITPAAVGALLAARAASSILSRLIVERLVQRWRRHILIMASTLGSAAALSAVALPVSGTAAMATALVLGGFLLGIGQPLTMTMIVRAVPVDTRGTALSLRLWGNRLGQVAIPGAAALVAGTAGAAGALWFVSAVLLAATAAVRTSAARRR
ncbi:MFS transporter [Streptomonospora salina]|uniref:MFS family permease n=1 Tax=Streptomonospora salina TaxID=104205 RepID=A0A841EIT8_9ACTN|nr:MFS transporter [Streptomonospora salina]MBB6000728.1 MFS family permease [Streptomonospora salina]